MRWKRLSGLVKEVRLSFLAFNSPDNVHRTSSFRIHFDPIKDLTQLPIYPSHLWIPSARSIPPSITRREERTSVLLTTLIPPCDAQRVFSTSACVSVLLFSRSSALAFLEFSRFFFRSVFAIRFIAFRFCFWEGGGRGGAREGK